MEKELPPDETIKRLKEGNRILREQNKWYRKKLRELKDKIKSQAIEKEVDHNGNV